jgi:5,10-methylenetetrahydrofolate reductase
MHRRFVDALAHRPLLFEPVPPSARASAEKAQALLEELARLVGTVERVDAVDVPELVDENHDGRPYYRSGDIRAFAHGISERTGCEAIVNKVVAHMPSADALAEWARETVGRGVPHVVLVGGSSRYIPYSGPSVAEADRICRPIVSSSGGRLGNIAIPQRTGEAHRMLGKSRAGASFFTTQILFDSEAVLRLIREYDQLCIQSGLPPSSILLSVAPLADEGDAEFVRWLGADIPDTAERSILNGDEKGATSRSIDHALHLWAAVHEGVRQGGVSVPVGVNVEQISQRHLASASQMLKAFARAIDEPTPAG